VKTQALVVGKIIPSRWQHWLGRTESWPFFLDAVNKKAKLTVNITTSDRYEKIQFFGAKLSGTDTLS
jgi:hypothetical protein